MIIAMCTWRVGGSTAEREGRFVFARIQAFASKSALSTSATRLSIFHPAVGFLEPSSWISKPEQMGGWDTSPMLDGKLSSASEIPPSPWHLGHDALFVTPQLSAANLSYNRFPHPTITYVDDPLFSKTTHPPACPADEALATQRNGDAAQHPLYHPSRPDTAPPSKTPPYVRPAGSAWSFAFTPPPSYRLQGQAAHPTPPVGSSAVQQMERNVRGRSVFRRQIERRDRIRATSFSRPLFAFGRFGMYVLRGSSFLHLKNGGEPANNVVVNGPQLLLQLNARMWSLPLTAKLLYPNTWATA